MVQVVQAQTSYHITTSQGLATHQLTVLIKDHLNNMWFGSYNGLHKHEGTAIKVYSKSAKDSNSISSNEVHPVFEDRLGFIWIGTTGGLDKLDPATGNITHYKVRSESQNDDNLGWIYSIFQDNQDNIWMYADLGLFIINYKTGTYRQVPGNQKSGAGIPETSIGYKGGYATDKGIWIAANCRLVFYDYKSRQFYHRYHNTQNKAIFKVGGNVSADAHSDICSDSSGNIYFIAKNSLLIKYNIALDKIDSFTFSFPENAWNCCFALAADYKGNIWVGFRNGGLLFFDHFTHSFTSIRYKNSNSLIGTDYVYSLCEDYLHRMWATTNNGIFIINYYDSIVQQQYLSDKTAFVNISYQSSITSQDGKGNILIPYGAGGLFLYNVFSGSNRYFSPGNLAVKEYGYVLPVNDKLYVSSYRSMLVADTTSATMQLHQPPAKLYQQLAALPARVVWAYKRNDQSIYFKKGNGAIYYYNGTSQLEKINSTGFTRQATVSKDSSSLYFLAENGNLVKRNLATLRMDTFELIGKLKTLHFLYANTRDLADDGRGNIWITTQNGLLKYNEAKDSIAVYTTANGLLHDFTFTLCSDSRNRLWVGSMGGVNYYDPQKDAFINVFTESRDKFSDYFGSSLEAPDGHIYFVFGGKLININPNGFLTRQLQQRQLHLNSIEINGMPASTSAKELAGLTYKQNRLYFSFGLLEFSEPEKVKYVYRLTGADDKWVSLGNRSEITFNSLPPGTYQLQINAIDVYGNDVPQHIVIPFTIHPPFWQTLWFKIIGLLTAGIIIFLAFKKKQQQINRQKQQLEIEQSINYISTAIHGQKNAEEMLWSITENCVSKLGFSDCVIYLLNDDRSALIQKAASGPKSTRRLQIDNLIPIPMGTGIVGSVALSGKSELIADMAKDSRYIPGDERRSAEVAVPIIYESTVMGVIDCKKERKGFFQKKHLTILNQIAAICAIKLIVIQAEQNIQHALLEMAENKRKLAGLELKALRAQMNPHFIFNAMNSIQHFSLQNDYVNANKYLTSFSKLLRMVLQQSEYARISLEKEIEILELYLAIEALRLGSNFTYRIEVEEDLETEAVLIPSMLVQPFVENALKHGLSAKQGDRILHITFACTDDKHIICTVADNGIGRKKSYEISHSYQELIPHQSMGMKIVNERLALLEQSENKLAGVAITDLYDDAGNSTGTFVKVMLPVE